MWVAFQRFDLIIYIKDMDIFVCVGITGCIIMRNAHLFCQINVLILLDNELVRTDFK